MNRIQHIYDLTNFSTHLPIDYNFLCALWLVYNEYIKILQKRLMTKKEINSDKSKEVKDANTCMALGAGVGVFGTAGAIVSGAVCPLCIFVAPGLVGYGAYRRWKATKESDTRNKPVNK